MAVRTDDLIAQLKQQILGFEAPARRTMDVGSVLEVGDGIAVCQRPGQCQHG